ncbi:MAG: PIN domain-containing protein [bacterium]|nr:PIN domain-containing protein [bacterium]
MVILDTNIIIDHLRSKNDESLLMKLVKESKKEELGISVLTIQELYEGRSTQDEKKEEMMMTTIAPLKIYSYTYEIAKLAGEIARDIDKPIEFVDAGIAATAIVTGSKLCSLNKKDFSDIQDLMLHEID